MCHRMFVLLISALLSACLGSGADTKPIQKAGDAAADYITAKRSYAQALSKALGVSDASNYRLVAVTGPEWKIGDAIDPLNPLNPLSYACEWKAAAIPASTQWTDLPGVSGTSTINFSLGLPTGVVKAFKSTAVTAGINVNSESTGNYSLTGLSGPIIAQDDFEKALKTGACKDSRDTAALLVRGVISGVEIFSSKKSLDAGGNVHVASIEVFNLKYDDSKNYELSDKTAAPKFYLVTLDTPSERGTTASGGLRAPPGEIIQTIESLNVVPKK